jgi:phenylalanyl-tRNA synthetase alpha chain
MTLEELKRQAELSLSDLGVQDEAGITAKFDEARETMGRERASLVSRSADQNFRQQVKEFRNLILARGHGLVARIKENWLDATPKHLKPAAGRAFNSLRLIAEELFEEEATFNIVDLGKKLVEFQAKPHLDLTLPGYCRPLGSLHPVTQMQREIEEIFLNLGFWIESGPEIESVYYNFDALNIPESHPSRDDWDTLYINPQTVLRTHTSPVQIRAMEKYGAPLYIIIPGKCYRHDNPDASHSPMFHQVEGLAIASDITFADLKGTLDFFAKKLFGEKVQTRFQPSFFPFTEPSGEVAISCIFCGGEGCRVCKESGWIEVMGCGMVHPQVLRNGGIDPEKYSGWAFGLGVDRFAMLKYDINDIQLFFQSDVRFLEQF